METLLLAATLFTAAPALPSVEPAPLVAFDEIAIDYEMSRAAWQRANPPEGTICIQGRRSPFTDLITRRLDWNTEILRSLER